jgi:hypothetical protein
MFHSLSEVRIMSQEWQDDYNRERPHRSLGYQSPFGYRQRWEHLSGDRQMTVVPESFSTKIRGEAPGGTSERIFSGKNICITEAESSDSNWPKLKGSLHPSQESQRLIKYLRFKIFICNLI